mmetsp:Transcript_39820/g.128917  ORF Transcript_39820/g.128917 Transcript_39820/m.128917 type:complete len:206 (-) Transcript_39820:402-1019(-)
MPIAQALPLHGQQRNRGSGLGPPKVTSANAGGQRGGCAVAGMAPWPVGDSPRRLAPTSSRAGMAACWTSQAEPVETGDASAAQGHRSRHGRTQRRTTAADGGGASRCGSGCPGLIRHSRSRLVDVYRRVGTSAVGDGHWSRLGGRIRQRGVGGRSLHSARPDAHRPLCPTDGSSGSEAHGRPLCLLVPPPRGDRLATLIPRPGRV